MFLNLNDVDITENKREYDLCIIGAGAAGISIAQKFARDKKLSVCLLEAGGLSYSSASQEKYDGTWANSIFGNHQTVDNRLVADRLRFFGGTTNHWVGRCRRFDRQDFKKRPWIPNSGWPISHSEMTDFYAAAEEVLDIQHHDYDSEKKQEHRIGDTTRSIKFTFSPPTRMGTKYKEILDVSRNVFTYLNCNFRKFNYSPTHGGVKSVLCSDYSGREFVFHAKTFVLATGGVENTRILLNESMNGAIGNKNIGRYFMGHAIWRTGVFIHRKSFPLKTYLTSINDSLLSFAWNDSRKFFRKVRLKLGEKDLGPYYEKQKRSHQDFLAMTQAAQKTHQLPNMGVTVESEYLPTNVDLSFLSVTDSLRMIRKEGAGFRYLALRSEQVPDENSRITLSNELDQFGLARANVLWKMNEQDKQSITTFNRLLNADMVKSGMGLLKNLFNPDEIPDKLWSGAHHIGGTRMADSSDKGVVDKNLKIFGLSNVYVAGCSVFPTSGIANPTLTIVALALKLADHLEGKIR